MSQFREEHRLRVFGNKALRGIFGPRRNKGMGNWVNVHNRGLYNLFSTQNIITVTKSKFMRLVEHAVLMGDVRNIYMKFI
jgi:hypothetical protein